MLFGTLFSTWAKILGFFFTKNFLPAMFFFFFFCQTCFDTDKCPCCTFQRKECGLTLLALYSWGIQATLWNVLPHKRALGMEVTNNPFPFLMSCAPWCHTFHWAKDRVWGWSSGGHQFDRVLIFGALVSLLAFCTQRMSCLHSTKGRLATFGHSLNYLQQELVWTTLCCFLKANVPSEL